MAFNKILTSGKSTLSIQNYVFSIVWATEGICSLNLLQGKTATGNWHQIITSAITDSDGEISVKIGEFNTGSQISIMFGATALTDLQKVAVFVTNIDSGESRKMLPPADETKDIEKPDSWSESFTFTTF